MSKLNRIIVEEIETYSANFPQFGDRLKNLDEYGEGNLPPYPFKLDDISYNEVNAYFDTEDGDEYVVMFNLTDRIKKIWEMQFGVAGGTPGDVINKGRMGKIMSTMIKITNAFIDKYQPNIIKFEPVKSKGEDDKSRLNLYMAYINKNMRPDYKVYVYTPFVIIEKKVKTIDRKAIQI